MAEEKPVVPARERADRCPAAISLIMFFTYTFIHSTQKTILSYNNNITFHRAKFKARG